MRLEELDYNRIGTLLTRWFSENARVLPWRTDPTPYHVWVSEIMLQQTRVEAVLGYYQRFLQALPDVQALADCPEDVYLKLWEGLGYYSRVRNLHKAAVQIMDEFGGEIPSDPASLRSLSGIGDYTAGAIGSIAFGKPVAAVDGNALRVLTRLAADPSDIADPQTKKRMQVAVDRFLEQMDEIEGAEPSSSMRKSSEWMMLNPLRNFSPGAFNQSIMDIGATVCLPNGDPKCDLCPVACCCRALAEGRVDEFPVKTAKKPRRIEEKTVLILRDGDQIAVHKRPERGLLAGLWEFPNLPGHLDPDALVAYARSLGYEPLYIEALGDAKHIFTHVEWHMTGYQLKLAESTFASAAQLAAREKAGLIFVDPAGLRDTYAIPSAFKKVTKGRFFCHLKNDKTLKNQCKQPQKVTKEPSLCHQEHENE